MRPLLKEPICLKAAWDKSILHRQRSTIICSVDQTVMSNIDIIKGLYQAFERGDINSVLDVLDPNVEWIESEGIPYGGTFIGREAVLNGVFLKIGADWDDFIAHVDEFLDAGDTIVTLGYDSGTYKATGKSMRAPTASVWTLKDGLVVKFVQYIDTLKVVEALSMLDNSLPKI